MKKKLSETKPNRPESKLGRQQRYRIRVQGVLDESWSEWFDGLNIRNQRAKDGSPISWLTGTFADQSALRGVLNRIWDLNLTLLSVEPLDVVDDEPFVKSLGSRQNDTTI